MPENRKAVLLVNPHIEDFAAYDHFSKPLGLIWLASYLKEKFDIYFINALNRLHPSVEKVEFKEAGTGHFHKTFIEKPEALSDIPRRFKRYGLPDDSFLEELKELPRAPEYVFITSAMTYWYTGLRHTIRLIRQIYPSAKIILGGIYAALLPGHARENSGADFVVSHQELPEVLGAVENITGERFSRELLPPAYSILDEYYYAPVLTSVGCIFSCSYCASRKLSRFRQFQPGWVADQIEYLNKNYGVDHFAFYDDALLFNSVDHIEKILRALIDKNIHGRYYTPNGLHIKYLTDQSARLMKECGFADIRLSLESCDPEFQRQEGRKTDNSEFLKAMELLYQAGFERKDIRVYTLLNVPGQDQSSVEKTMRFVYENGAVPMLAFYSPIPGTPDFEKSKRITDVSEPLFQNNTVYLYRSGFDMDYLHYLKGLEKEYRRP